MFLHTSTSAFLTLPWLYWLYLLWVLALRDAIDIVQRSIVPSFKTIVYWHCGVLFDWFKDVYKALFRFVLYCIFIGTALWVAYYYFQSVINHKVTSAYNLLTSKQFWVGRVKYVMDNVENLLPSVQSVPSKNHFSLALETQTRTTTPFTFTYAFDRVKDIYEFAYCVLCNTHEFANNYPRISSFMFNVAFVCVSIYAIYITLQKQYFESKCDKQRKDANTYKDTSEECLRTLSTENDKLQAELKEVQANFEREHGKTNFEREHGKCAICKKAQQTHCASQGCWRVYLCITCTKNIIETCDDFSKLQ